MEKKNKRWVKEGGGGGEERGGARALSSENPIKKSYLEVVCVGWPPGETRSDYIIFFSFLLPPQYVCIHL